MDLQPKKSKQSKEINLDLLKTELAIAKTSFEIAKKYKKIAQNLDSTNVDQEAILPFYIFASYAHLNHSLMSIRKILFDKDSKTALSLARYFNRPLKQELIENKKVFLNLKQKYSGIQDDISEVIAHIGKNRNQNSVFQIQENRFREIGDLLNESAELINNFPDNKSDIFPDEYGGLNNVIFGFDNLIIVANNGIKSRVRENKK